MTSSVKGLTVTKKSDTTIDANTDLVVRSITTSPNVSNDALTKFNGPVTIAHQSGKSDGVLQVEGELRSSKILLNQHPYDNTDIDVTRIIGTIPRLVKDTSGTLFADSDFNDENGFGGSASKIITKKYVDDALLLKQSIIDDGDLSIAKTAGLQAALDQKQDIVLDGDLTIAKTDGLQAALDQKQAIILDGDLTIAKTDGLQAALESKQDTINDNDLTISQTSGLQDALDAASGIQADEENTFTARQTFNSRVTTPAGSTTSGYTNDVLYAGTFEGFGSNTAASSTIRALKNYSSALNGPALCTGSSNGYTNLGGKFGGIWDMHGNGSELACGWSFNYKQDSSLTQINCVAKTKDGVTRTIWKNIASGNSAHTMRLNGDTNITSDDRLKSNAIPISSALAALSTITVYRYNKLVTPVAADYDYPLNANNEPIDDTGEVVTHVPETGVIAQDLLNGPFAQYVVIDNDESLSSEISTTGMTDLHTVRYGEMLLHCIPAIQELATRLEDAERTISSLNSRIETLEQEL
jgi:hypothetical protein